MHLCTGTRRSHSAASCAGTSGPNVLLAVGVHFGTAQNEPGAYSDTMQLQSNQVFVGPRQSMSQSIQEARR